MRKLCEICILMGLLITANAQDSIMLTCNAVNDTVCVGDSVTFTASPGYDVYKFSNGSSVQQVGPSNIWVTLLANGNNVFVIGIRNDTVSYPSNIINITVNISPLVLNLESNVSLCGADSGAVFTAISTPLNTAYSFSINSQILQTGLSNTFNTNNLNPGDSVTVIAELNDCPSPPFSDVVFQVPETNLLWDTLESEGKLDILGSGDLFCNQSDTILRLQGGSPFGGSYSGFGVTNGVLNAAAYSSVPCKCGVDTIRYTYTDSHGCSATAVNTLRVSDCVNSIGLLESSGLFDLYPNPTTELVTFDFSPDMQGSMLYITDLLGKDHMYLKLLTSPQQIDVSGLTSGTYLARMNSEGYKFVRLFIKQ